MYVWKINMIDGTYFLVHSDENDAIKFTKALLPRNGAEAISTFKSAVTNTYSDYKYDSVVIIGSKVSSVEYFIGESSK